MIIVLGRPENYLIDMQDSIGNTLVHSDLDLQLSGQPQLVPGVVGRSLYLDGGGQYLDIGDHSDECLGNLAKCPSGITIAAWINFKNYYENMYIMSTGNNGIRMRHRNGYIETSVVQNGKAWEVSIPRFDENTWNHVELSWHPAHSLSVYVNNTLVHKATYVNVPVETRNTGTKFYVGRSNIGDSVERSNYADMKIDEMEIWYGRREELLAFDYIKRGMLQTQGTSIRDVFIDSQINK